ncbi:MAG: GTPase ObgE [Bacteroidales bacterium]|nr:GTPase ObgE [Bacteroidales bacterium]
MSESNFIDYIRIYCRSGKGGAGAVHFIRTRKNPRGGPDGGDGGRGGHVIVRGNAQLWTLFHLRYTKHIIAGDGESGSGARKAGASGEDKVIEVPVGTVVKKAETNELVGEINKDGEEFILLPGGRGGKGNDFFKSPVLRTPRFAQPGEEGQEGWFVFELKLLADVGLVGFPNAGKSTLLSVLSAAKPKIADYPFTTLVPQLGVVPYRDYFSFVMADIPGIIEGAHEGKGLGLRFLRHIERNSILLFLIPADLENPIHHYHVLLNELDLYNPSLLLKKRLIAVSKADLLDNFKRRKWQLELSEFNPVFISSRTGEGLMQLKDTLWKLLNE